MKPMTRQLFFASLILLTGCSVDDEIRAIQAKAKAEQEAKQAASGYVLTQDVYIGSLTVYEVTNKKTGKVYVLARYGEGLTKIDEWDNSKPR